MIAEEGRSFEEIVLADNTEVDKSKKTTMSPFQTKTDSARLSSKEKNMRHHTISFELT